MEKNIVWEVIYFNRTMDYESINTYIFSNRKDARKFVRDLIKDMKTNPYHWVSKVFRKDNEDFELDTNMDDKTSIEWYWIYEDITDYVYKAQIELREKEVV